MIRPMNGRYSVCRCYTLPYFNAVKFLLKGDWADFLTILVRRAVHVGAGKRKKVIRWVALSGRLTV